MAISVRRVTFLDATMDTTFQDLLVAGSGEKLTLLRTAYRLKSVVTGSPFMEIVRTDSSDVVKETLLDTGVLSAVDAQSIVLDEDGVASKADFRNIVLTDQDKLRVRRVGGNDLDMEITMDMVEEV